MSLGHLTILLSRGNSQRNRLRWAKSVWLGLSALLLGSQLQAQEPAPVFTPAGGVLSREMRVQVSSTDSQATIHYTTNGVDPTISDKAIASGSNVLIPRNLVLKAKAWNGVQASAITTGTFWPGSAITARGQHGLALRFNGEVFGWGLDSSGQLGDGASSTPRSTPVFVLTGSGGPHLNGVSAVAAGFNHTLVITGTEGSVYAFGDNAYSQLAQGNTTDAHYPILVTGSAGAVFNDVDSIAAGDNHSLAIKSDGSLWAWGRNTNGSIGVGNTAAQKYPVRVLASGTYPGGAPFGPVCAAAGGADHSVAISSTDASVWAWGLNTSYQLGDNTKTARSNPGQVKTMVSGTLVPFTGATQVSCGGNFTLALKADGSVWAWGNNTYGQIGVGTSGTINNQRFAAQVQLSGTAGNPLTGVVAVAAGDSHSLALKDDGTVLAWGYNYYGQCGDGTPTNRPNPVVVQSGSGVALQNIVAIAAGSDFSMAMSSDGMVYTWGRPASGQLGNGSTSSATSSYATLYSTIPQVSKRYPTVTMQPITGTWIVPATIQMTATANDPDGYVRQIDFLGNDSLLVSFVGGYGAYGSANFMWCASSSGTFTVRAVGTDYDGGSASSAGQTVTVYPPTITVAAQATNVVEPAGSAPSARFYSPWGVAADALGNLYVDDLYNFVIRKITVDGNVSTLAGSPGVVGYSDGFGSYAQFNNPRGVAVDANGNVYVADTVNDTIRKITPDGTVSLFAGSTGTGASWDGIGRLACFNQPVGVAADANGNVYVADTGNCTIRKITASGSTSTLAGSPGLSGTTDGSGSAARFSTYASALAVDASGNIYVADSTSSTIRKITPAGAVTTFAGSPGLTGTSDGVGTSARFYYPEGIAVDASGNVYVADTSNYTIRKITPAGAVSTLAGSPGISGTTDGTGSSARFYQIAGLAVDPSGNIYVAESSYNTIRKVTPDGTVSTFAGIPGTGGCIDTVGSFRITRNFTSTPPNVPLDISYAISGTANPGTDYVALSGSATIPPGQAYVDVPVTPLEDMLVDGPESVTLTLNSQTSYLVGSASSATLTILDTPPTVAVSKTADAGYDSNLAAVPGNFRFTRTGPLGPLTVGYSVISAASPGMDYQALSGTVAFAQNVSVVDVPVTPILQGQASEDLAVAITSATTYAIASGSGRSIMRLEMPTGKITGGGTHTLALKTNGRLTSWGQQANGRLGNNLTASGTISTPQSVLKLSASGTFSDAIAIAAGVDHSLAIDRAGNVYSFGNNSFGQLGNNTVTGTAVAVQVLTGTTGANTLGGSVAVASGSAFSLALTGTGAREVMAWGINNDGRLGNNLTSGTSKTAGYVINYYGGGHLSGIHSIAAGDRFGLALDASGNIWSWGYNGAGQLGNGMFTSRSNAQQVRNSGTTSGALLSDVMEIGAGVDFSVAVRRNATEMSTVWCWGQQSQGRLGNTLTTSGSVPVPTPVRTGTSAQLSGTLQNIIQVACGPAHTLALDVSGTVWTWGANAYGQLGDGTVNARGYAAPVTFPLGNDGLPPAIVYVGAGGCTSGTNLVSFSYAISKAGQVYSWGYNMEGELGMSGTASQKTPAAPAGMTKLSGQWPTVTLALSPGSGPYIDPLNLTMTATASDLDGSIARIDLYNGSTLLQSSSSSNPFVFQWNGIASGTYSFTAVATDNDGFSTATAAQTVTVLPMVSVTAQIPTATEPPTLAPARFNSPDGVAVDATGNVYVADSQNHTLRKIKPTGEVTTLAGTAGGWGGLNGSGSAASFSNIGGAAVDSSGNIYVADTTYCTIRKISPSGVVSTIAGTSAVSGSADGTGSAASFNYPQDVAVDSQGYLYVADCINCTVRKISPAGVVTTLAGSPGVAGTRDGTGANAQFYYPSGITVDSSGNVYVVDEAGNDMPVRKITPAGVVSSLAGTGTFGQLFGITVDASGNIYVADSEAVIRKITPGGISSILAGSPGISGTTDGRGPSARFNEPSDLSLDASGNIYVADEHNHTIRKITPDGMVSTIAGTPGVTGTNDTSTLPGAFRISRTFGGAPPNTPLDISYSVVGSATMGSDYLALSGHATIPGGQSYVDVPITPLLDSQAEGTESVILTLNPQPGYLLASASSATVSIIDTPPPLVVSDQTVTCLGSSLAGTFPANYYVNVSFSVGSNTTQYGGTVAISGSSGFIYTPQPNWTGTDSFTFTGINGVGASGTGTVTVIVTPLSGFPGIQSWFKADTGVTRDATGKVSSWADQSPCHMDASQTNSANQPVLVSGSGASVLHFDGISSALKLPSGFANLSGGLTALVVFKPDGIKANTHAFELGNGVQSDQVSFGIATGPSKLGYQTYQNTSDAGHVEGIGAPLDANHLHIYGVTQSVAADGINGDALLTCDGRVVGHGPVGAALNITRAQNSIGGSFDRADSLFAGDIAEVVIFNRPLSAGERKQIENYLASKYAINLASETPTPYLTGFESNESPAYSLGSLVGQQFWLASDSAAVQSSLVRNGSQAITLQDPGAKAEHYFSAASATPTTSFSLYLSGNASFSPSQLPLRASSLVSFDPAQGIMAFDGDGAGGGNWRAASGTAQLANTWVTIGIQQDYGARKWSLVVNGQVILSNLGFKDNSVDSLFGLHFENRAGGGMGIDDVSVANP